MQRTLTPDLTRSRFHNIIKAVPFFACLSDEDVAEIHRVIVEKRFYRNQIILQEEDTPNYMYIIGSGKVKVVQVSDDGKEQILAIHHEGEFFGEMTLLDGKTSPANVVAMEDASIGMISREDFERHLLKNEKILKGIISLLCSRLRESWMMLRVFGFGDAEQRVRAMLGFLGMQHGSKNVRGTTITLKLTHEDIANYSSVSRETVTRLLGKFTRSGEIEFLEDRLILLKPAFFNRLHFM